MAVPAQAGDRLTLDDAFQRVARTHPDLQLFGPRTDQLLAERDQATLGPPLAFGAELENAFGSGTARGLEGAELTLSLAGVFERGGKLDARRTLAQQRIDALAGERELRRLDLLADTTRRYLESVVAEARITLAGAEVEQRRLTVAAARQRLQAGASPESVLLTAQAALARAELEQARALQQAGSQRRRLAALWGEREPSFELARASGSTDLDWQVGVRRLQAEGDTALVAGFSMPLGSRGRAMPGIREAEAALAGVEVEREARGLGLYTTLLDAHGRYTSAQLETRRLGADVLPRLRRAADAAGRAWRAGAISYLEWAQLQSEHAAVAQRRLDAALEGRLALVEIQRLTGQPIVASPAPSEGTTP